MTPPLKSLISTGTKLWLDSVDPDLVESSKAIGATGATSNPAIVGDLIRTGRFDDGIRELFAAGHEDLQVAWQLTDRLVSAAQKVFHPVWKQTAGNDGYVSFELDPLIEDPDAGIPHAARVAAYIELGEKWSAGHDNRMIKVPATPAGIDALEALAAAGTTINVTLIFTPRQYASARDAIWRGAQQRSDLSKFKSVYSVFVSRLDAYTEKEVTHLSDSAQGSVGIVNAKRIWRTNQEFWEGQSTPLQQEIVFASTGTKNPQDDPWKYVIAFAGSDIETNPPKTNDATQASGLSIEAGIQDMPSLEVLQEIDAKVDFDKLEEVLMSQGIQKFADPQKALLALLAEKRATL